MRVASRCAKRDGNFWPMEAPRLVGNPGFLPGSRVISEAGFEILSRLARLWAQWCVLVRGRSFYQRRTREDLRGNRPRRFLFLECGKICARRARVVITVVLRVRAIRT